MESSDKMITDVEDNIQNENSLKFNVQIADSNEVKLIMLDQKNYIIL